MEDYKLLATNPQQYDDTLDWTVGGDVNHSSRIFFRKFLLEDLEDLRGKSVLDIGSGVGQLFPTLKELGAEFIQGIEPSKRNVEHSLEQYPDVSVYQGTLQDFSSDKLFDSAICIMAFEHIFDIKDAFDRVARLLKTNGTFYLMVGDKDYHTQSQIRENDFNQKVEVQELGNGVVATKTIYPEGTIHDIFRPFQSIIDTGVESGFELKKHIPMHSSKGVLVCHFMIFKKK